MKRQHANRSATGFTLIELLVVIAIIAILAAILFPVFAQARETARQIACASNMKQIGSAILMYAQDYDERFPGARYDTPPPLRDTPTQPFGPYRNQHFDWPQAVLPYIKNAKVFQCPSLTPGRDANNPNANNGDCTGHSQYAINRRIADAWHGGRNGVPWGTPNPVTQSELGFPAATIMVTENAWCGSGGSETDDRYGWGWADGHHMLVNGSGAAEFDRVAGNRRDNSNNSYAAPLRRHKGGANYLFADGHVKWYAGDASYVVWDSRTNRTGSTMTYEAN